MGLREFEPKIDKQRQLEKRLATASRICEKINNFILFAAAHDRLKVLAHHDIYTDQTTGKIVKGEKALAIVNIEDPLLDNNPPVLVEVSKYYHSDPVDGTKINTYGLSSRDTLPVYRSRLTDRTRDRDALAMGRRNESLNLLIHVPIHTKQVQDFRLELISNSKVGLDKQVLIANSINQQTQYEDGPFVESEHNITAILARTDLNLERARLA